MPYRKDTNQKKDLTLVFFGLGSIGSRLARLIRDNFNHKMYAFRTRREKVNDLRLPEVYSLSEMEKLSPDVAFITNPTSLHIETAIQSASMGMHLFIEKPLCDGLDRWNSLVRTVQEKKVITYVACNLRFDPIIQFLKTTLNPDEIFYSRVICSSYLPQWRPDQDYKKSYSAKKDLGGGVILDLIHEPDYCHWLFQNIRKITGHAGSCGRLAIETEDFADMNLYHSSGILSNVHIDYFGYKPQRKIEVFGNHLYVNADLIERTVTTVTEEEERLKKFNSINGDYTYEQELKYFFRCLDDDKPPSNSIFEHMKVLRPLLEFKKNIQL